MPRHGITPAVVLLCALAVASATPLRAEAASPFEPLLRPFAELIAPLFSVAHVPTADEVLARIDKEMRSAPETAWRDLKGAARDNIAIGVRAHDLGHRIGALFYEREGLAGLVQCDPSFVYACYHGFLKEAFQGGHSAAELFATCRPSTDGPAGTPQQVRSYAFLAGCAHGIGHGLLEGFGYDLGRALDECDTLPADSDVLFDDTGGVYLNPPLACKEGLFMEYYQGNYGELTRDDPWKTCALLGADDALPCARYVHYLGYAWNLNLADTVQLCLKAPTRSMRNDCFYEVGFFENGLSASTLPSDDVIVSACAAVEDPETRYRCLRAGAFTFMIQHYPDAPMHALRICASVPDSGYRAKCLNWLRGTGGTTSS